jgi:UDP-N-acetylmuramate dehydrogenase
MRLMLKTRNVTEHEKMAPHTTIQVGGEADYFGRATSAQMVKELCDWATSHSLPVFVLGEGSNIVVSEEPLHRLVIKVEITGVQKVSDTKDSLTLEVGAGEHWDSVVERTVKLGLSGIEAMSMIPGTAGAAPVQNAGAYGQEIADTLVSLDAYDMISQKFVTLTAAECGFEYRMSRFKTDAAGRYVITSVTLKLSKKAPAAPTYESLKRYLDEQQIENPSPQQIRDGVMAVRARILPDPSVVPNAGSFFKNPIVSAKKLAELEREHDKVPSFRYGTSYKIAAGWIVEQCGFKGSEHFGLKIWPNQALVITNPNGASFKDLLKLVELITKTVQDKFGITLEPEPQFIN